MNAMRPIEEQQFIYEWRLKCFWGLTYLSWVSGSVANWTLMSLLKKFAPVKVEQCCEMANALQL
jgi:hypothetical protein